MDSDQDQLFDLGLDDILSQQLDVLVSQQAELLDVQDILGGQEDSDRSKLSLSGKPRRSLYYEMPKMPVSIVLK